jgi:hypothetical protein
LASRWVLVGGSGEEVAVGFLSKVRTLWQAEAQQYVHGWIRPNGPAAPVEPGEGRYYLQVRCAAMSLRFSRERFADRSPVLQSVIRWPTRGERIAVSQTIDQSRFTQAGDAGTSGFRVFDVADKALSGDLPLNAGDVEVDVAVLAAPGSSLLKQATSFLSEVASLTMIPQLTAAAPVATKIASGVDTLLGNDDVEGILAFSTSVPAGRPRPGYYAVTDIVATSDDDLQRLDVKDDQLLRYSHERDRWEPATGFSYLLLEFRVEETKPSRWTELPEIVDLCESALEQLSKARTEQDIREAWPQMHLAVLKALYNQNLAHSDRDPAARALTDQWKQEVDRLAEVAGPHTLEAAHLGEVTPERVAAGPAEPAPPRPEPARAPIGPGGLDAAHSLGRELEEVVHRIQVEEVDVQARDIAGTVKGIGASSTSWVKAGKVKVEADRVSSGGTVIAIDAG